MKILAIETTGKYGGVCLGIGEKEVFCKTNSAEMEHLSCALPMAYDILKEADKKLEDVDAVAVSVGPGSFTGMRIGIAFARAIAQARGTKCIAVNTLAAFCLSSNLERQNALLCLPLLDARRGQVYAAAYSLKNLSVENRGMQAETQMPEELIATDVYMLEDYLKLLEKLLVEKFETKELVEEPIKLFFTGNASVKYQEQIRAFTEKLEKSRSIKIDSVFEKAENAEQNARNVLGLAKLMYKENKFIDYDKITPAYLRKAEAERKLEGVKKEEIKTASDVISIQG